MNKKNKVTLFILVGISLSPIVVIPSVRIFLWDNIGPISSLATAFAFAATVYSAYFARDIAKKTEYISKKAIFEQRFTLVLEQHNQLLNVIKDWILDKENSTSPYNEVTKKIYSPLEAVNIIRGHAILSPYMRILYHTLKTVDVDCPANGKQPREEIYKEQKKYTSLLRSFIPNDILFLISINSSVTNYEYFEITNSEDYIKYQYLLNKYDFFEHLIIKTTGKTSLQDIANKVEEHTIHAIYYRLANKQKIIKYTYDNSYGIYKQGVWDEKTHINYINETFKETKFLISIVYNLKNKYISDTLNNKSNAELLNEKIAEKLDTIQLTKRLKENKKNYYHEIIKNTITSEIKEIYTYEYIGKTSFDTADEFKIRFINIDTLKDKIIKVLNNAIINNNLDETIKRLDENKNKFICRISNYKHTNNKISLECYDRRTKELANLLEKIIKDLEKKINNMDNVITNTEYFKKSVSEITLEIKESINIYIKNHILYP